MSGSERDRMRERGETSRTNFKAGQRKKRKEIRRPYKIRYYYKRLRERLIDR